MSKVHFIVIEPSFIVRNGLVNLINELPNAIVLREVEQVKSLSDTIEAVKVNAAVINASLLRSISNAEKKKLSSIKSQVSIIVLHYSRIDSGEVYDEFADASLILSEQRSSVANKIKNVISRHQPNSLQQDTADLSEREVTILKDVALGFSSKEIADKNFISPHTVVTHRKNITRKLGIKTVSGLVIYAILNKIIEVDELK